MGPTPRLSASEWFMFDRMVFTATLNPVQVRHVIDRLHLVCCSRGDKTFWSSDSYALLDGRHAVIDDTGHIKLSCSIHKLHEKATNRVLDNSTPISVTDVCIRMVELFTDLTISVDAVKVRYMEVGLSFPMPHPPLEYISQMVSVGDDKDREMFVDFHYEKNRMKVTAKTRFHRKCLKVYDKTFEAAEKGRTVRPNVLRIETQYRRMNIPLTDLLSEATREKYLFQFYQDWSHVTWVRDITVAAGVKGIKTSQLAKAREIMTIGVDAYLERHRQEWKAGALSDKTWRTYREFAAAWPGMQQLFVSERGPLEADYDNMLQQEYPKANPK